MPLIAIDAGHGGGNSSAINQGRRERDDTLALALAVGCILEANGMNRCADGYFLCHLRIASLELKLLE